MRILSEVEAVVGRGLTGDRATSRSGGRRQVTLIQQEHLAVIAALSGSAADPAGLRRNLVISGINLLALMRARFQIGEVLLEGGGPCVPCARMVETLGPNGLAAMHGHGGINAMVLVGGRIRLGDAVHTVTAPAVPAQSVLGLE